MEDLKRFFVEIHEQDLKLMWAVKFVLLLKVLYCLLKNFCA